jgi:hypothetical protein
LAGGPVPLPPSWPGGPVERDLAERHPVRPWLQPRR